MGLEDFSFQVSQYWFPLAINPWTFFWTSTGTAPTIQWYRLPPFSKKGGIRLPRLAHWIQRWWCPFRPYIASWLSDWKHVWHFVPSYLCSLRKMAWLAFLQIVTFKRLPGKYRSSGSAAPRTSPFSRIPSTAAPISTWTESAEFRFTTPSTRSPRLKSAIVRRGAFWSSSSIFSSTSMVIACTLRSTRCCLCITAKPLEVLGCSVATVATVATKPHRSAAPHVTLNDEREQGGFRRERWKRWNGGMVQVRCQDGICWGFDQLPS